MSFLTAEWRKLILANYTIDPAVLLPYLPHGTELDLWDGKCYASVVGFMFVNTRLLGIPIPFHVNFEEVNLRFYVRYKDQGDWKRGVVFIKEIVPRFAITWVANTLYKEHYQTLPMRHQWETTGQKLNVSYSWKYQGHWQRLGVQATAQPMPITEGTEAHFITEHYWGYTKVSDTKTSEYQVTHPTWDQYPVTDYAIDMDFGALYGPAFSMLDQQEPVSVMLAEGSPITVEPFKKI
jgi:uncharacterized protein YqjF (DUF2071 family)